MLLKFIELAFTVGLSSTYGFGSYNCGDYDKPAPCEKGAITASGDIFDPSLPTAAVAAPRSLRMYNVVVYMSASGGPCVPILINDKMNERYIGVRGFDLTPGALAALGLERQPQLVHVESCTPEEISE